MNCEFSKWPANYQYITQISVKLVINLILLILEDHEMLLIYPMPSPSHKIMKKIAKV